MVIPKGSKLVNSNIYLSFLWFPKLSWGKFLFIRHIFISKIVELIKLWKKVLIKNLKVYKIFSDIYGESLLISFRAFLPSLRVLNTSQEREKIIKTVSVVREKWILSALVVI